jgi:mannan endo-1,4-beta-mannosidase
MKTYFSTQIYDLVLYFKYFILYVVIQSCASKDSLQELNDNSLLFRVEGSQLLKENSPVFYKGVNVLQTYGLGNAELMDRWNIEILREFIGNLREQPISE